MNDRIVVNSRARYSHRFEHSHLHQYRHHHQQHIHSYSNQQTELVHSEKKETVCGRKRRLNKAQQDRHDQPCNLLAINDKIKGDKLNSIADQLAHLVQDPNISSPSEPRDNCARIRTILRIYWKLLNLSPLEFHLSTKEPIFCSNKFNIVNSRIQVLCYIENLDGYCDAINKLRLILKSPSMISVMMAFNKIIRELETRKVESKCHENSKWKASHELNCMV